MPWFKRLLVCAAVVAASLSVTVPAPAHPTGGPGRLVAAGPLPADLRLAGAGAAWWLRYRSVSWTGGGTVVGGSLTVPAGRPPAGGWPVVTFAHGANGVGDACAETRTGPAPWERVLLQRLLVAGFAVAVTDFEGIGTPGDSPFIDGPSEAHDMLDILRAGRSLAPLSRRYAVVGYSLGGHAALFTAALAERYAPELRLTRTVALAPLTQFGVLLSQPSVADPAGVPTPWLPYEGNAFALTRPDVVALTDWFTPTGLRLAALARTACIGEVAAAMAGLTNGDVLRDPATATREAAEVLAPQEIPVRRYTRPVLLMQGDADTSVPPPLTALTADQLAAAGTDVTYATVPGADHYTLLPTVADRVAAFLTAPGW